MAWIFSLSAECGGMREDAETFSAHFHDLILTLSGDITVQCSSSVGHCDREGNWWSLVHPEGVIAGGDTNFELCKTKRATEIGFLLYEHLKSAPPFRYAIVGWEVDGFYEASEFETDDLQNLDGLVFSQEFYKKFDCFSTFELFAPSYYWLPYLGEKWEPYSNKEV